MDLQEYIKQAVRTESVKQTIEVDSGILIELMAMHVAVTEMLDGIKKAAFYNNTSKLEDLRMKYAEVAKLHSDNMKMLNSNELSKDKFELNTRIFHGILGIATESGELMQALLSSIINVGTNMDSVNIQEELNDINWYQAIIHDELNLNWEDGLRKNIEKLRARFPEKFTEHDANNRNLEKERQILEGNE